MQAPHHFRQTSYEGTLNRRTLLGSALGASAGLAGMLLTKMAAAVAIKIGVVKTPPPGQSWGQFVTPEKAFQWLALGERR